jgi:hypothetical protein
MARPVTRTIALVLSAAAVAAAGCGSSSKSKSPAAQTPTPSTPATPSTPSTTTTTAAMSKSAFCASFKKLDKEFLNGPGTVAAFDNLLPQFKQLTPPPDGQRLYTTFVSAFGKTISDLKSRDQAAFKKDSHAASEAAASLSATYCK